MAAAPALPGSLPPLPLRGSDQFHPVHPSVSCLRSNNTTHKLSIERQQRSKGSKLLARTLPVGTFCSICKLKPTVMEHANHRRPDLTCLPLPARKHDSGSGFRPDEWLHRCILEVVKNIQEAPFLQLVFDSRGDSRTERQLLASDLFNREPREDASWCNIKDALAKAAPDGVILVQKLRSDILMDASMTEPEVPSVRYLAAEDSQIYDSTDAITDVWGLLLLGESPSKNACYILETTRISSCAGICTRFCLTRAQCFGPCVREQLERMWLVSSSE